MNEPADNAKRLQPGLGLVELMIALSISVMLLGSVAVAFHASLRNVEENQQIASVTQQGRVVLNRMMSESRQAIDLQCQTHKLSILPPDDGSGVSLIEYHFDADSGILYYRVTRNGVVESYPIISPSDGVTITGFSVTGQSGYDAQGIACTVKVTVVMNLAVGNNTFAVTSSCAPRRNQSW